jgi:surface polysaccharide O-acyltransferase-like enzyme
MYVKYVSVLVNTTKSVAFARHGVYVLPAKNTVGVYSLHTLVLHFVRAVKKRKRASQLQHVCLTAQIPIYTRGRKRHVSELISCILQ